MAYDLDRLARGSVPAYGDIAEKSRFDTGDFLTQMAEGLPQAPKPMTPDELLAFSKKAAKISYG